VNYLCERSNAALDSVNNAIPVRENMVS